MNRSSEGEVRGLTDSDRNVRVRRNVSCKIYTFSLRFNVIVNIPWIGCPLEIVDFAESVFSTGTSAK